MNASPAPIAFLQPRSWAEALALKAEHPEALPLCGGTDVMVELNLGDARPEAILDLSHVPEQRGWAVDGGDLVLGSGLTYARMVAELPAHAPGLAAAARTVGSPQIRHRGTLGGNLGSASPAGDAHPPLLAGNAVVHVASARGSRDIPVAAFFTGPKRNALAPHELVESVRLPRARGPQRFAKVGTRNAMVIAVCSLGVSLDPTARTVGTGVGSAGPTPFRATEAEAYAATALPWDDPRPLPTDVARDFGELVAAAAAPIDDVRATAAYRRHALAVLARRALGWVWQEHRGAEVAA